MVDEGQQQQTESSAEGQQNVAYLKRREQVRRAQRTHRERKEAYIKSLENEVLQYRANEARILQETQGLYSEVSRLKKILEEHGIPHGSQVSDIPPQAIGASSPGTSSLVSIRQNPHRQQQIHVRNPRRSPQGQEQQFYLSESEASPPLSGRRRFPFFRSKDGRSPDSNEDGSTNSEQATSTAELSTGLSSSTSALSLRDIDQTNLGMEFVLTLEAPCLHHTQGDQHEPYTPSGHALTASAPLLFQSHTQPVPTTSSHPTQWEAPNMGLEKLLDLSTNFELEDEVTPVQAWNHIRQHPNFETLEVPRLRNLTENMLKHVKCYGFGAVIDTATFEALVAEVLPSGIF